METKRQKPEEEVFNPTPEEWYDAKIKYVDLKVSAFYIGVLAGTEIEIFIPRRVTVRQSGSRVKPVIGEAIAVRIQSSPPETKIRWETLEGIILDLEQQETA